MGYMRVCGIGASSGQWIDIRFDSVIWSAPADSYLSSCSRTAVFSIHFWLFTSSFLAAIDTHTPHSHSAILISLRVEVVGTYLIWTIVEHIDIDLHCVLTCLCSLVARLSPLWYVRTSYMYITTDILCYFGGNATISIQLIHVRRLLFIDWLWDNECVCGHRRKVKILASKAFRVGCSSACTCKDSYDSRARGETRIKTNCVIFCMFGSLLFGLLMQRNEMYRTSNLCFPCFQIK